MKYAFIPICALLLTAPCFAQAIRMSASQEAAVIANLESEDPGRVDEALHDLLVFKGDSPIEDVVTPRIKKALVDATENEIARREAGVYSEGDHHELLFSLADALIALKDPETLPLLMNVAHKGRTPQRGILSFGPDIVPVLVRHYSENKSATVSERTGALDMLRAAYNEWGSFDDETLAIVKELIIENLTLPEGYVYDPEVSHTNRWAALSLAGRLGEDDLKPYVEALVDIEEESVTRLKLPYLVVFESGFHLFSNYAWHALRHWGEKQNPDYPSDVVEVLREPEPDH